MVKGKKWDSKVVNAMADGGTEGRFIDFWLTLLPSPRTITKAIQMGVVVGTGDSFRSQSSLSTEDGRRSTGQALVGVGVDLVKKGQLDEALDVFQRALTVLSCAGSGARAGTSTGATDHKRGASTTRSTSSEDNSTSSSSNHVPKLPPSSSVLKRLRRARNIASRDGASVDKKRKTGYDSTTSASTNVFKSQGKNSSSSTTCRTSRPPKTAARRRAEKISQAEMYSEEASEDSGTQRFSEPLRIEHRGGVLPECILSPPTALLSSSITCDAAIAAYNVAVTTELLEDREEVALLSYRHCLFLLSNSTIKSTPNDTYSLLCSMALNNIANILYKKEKLHDSERYLIGAMRGTPEVFDHSNGNIDTAAVQMDPAEIASILSSLTVCRELSPTDPSNANASRLQVQAKILSNLGRILFRFSRLTEALAVCLTISTIQKRLVGDSPHMAVAVIEYNIGLIKHKMGSSVEAKTHYENFLRTATLPIESGGVGEGPGGRIIIAFARHQVGLLLSLFGQKEDAMRALSEALALRRSVYGKDHAEISKTLFSVGQIQFERGLHNQSLSTFHQVIKMAHKVLPPNHMIFVFSLSYVAQIYRSRGHTVEALTIYEKCYAVAIKAFGHNHYVVIDIVNSIAQLRLSRGEYGQAAAAFGRASGLVVQTIINSSCSNHGSVVTTRKQKAAKTA